MSSPEEIQQRIEATRSSLSNDVERLGEKVSPGKVVGRRVDRVKGSMTSVRDRVMGSADDGSGVHGAASTTRDAVGSASAGVGSAASSVGDAASSVGQAASNAPQAIRRQAHGNPLAAGVIAFGVGWLLSSLAPASEREKQVARQVESKAGDLAEPIKHQAMDVAEELKQPAQHAAEQVKATATDAATQTADQARSAASDVREPLQQ
jgi:Protein of unknown function (DUF3618)